MSKLTGLFDCNGTEIKEGDYVGLEGMTTDDTLGVLPNGWFFNKIEDIFKVYWDSRINNWALDIPTDFNDPYQVKYLNHAMCLLHEGDCEIVTMDIQHYCR